MVLREDQEKTTPIPRIVAAQRRSGQALKVKPMSERRSRTGREKNLPYGNQ